MDGEKLESPTSEDNESSVIKQIRNADKEKAKRIKELESQLREREATPDQPVDAKVF